jgi:hypothetical protein
MAEYMIDPTMVVFEAISNDERALSRLQGCWDEELYDLRGEFVEQNRYERVERLREWFYGEAADFITFNKSYLAKIFDALTNEELIDWDELESLLYEGAEDED